MPKKAGDAEPKTESQSIQSVAIQPDSAPTTPAAVVARLQPVKRTPAQPKESSTRPGVWIIQELDPPYTSPLQVVPVDGAHYGLGIRHLEEGLDFVFERWAPVSPGDTYRMWMNGILVAEDTVQAGEQGNPRFFLNVPRTVVELGFVPDVYGEVQRVGSSTPSVSPPQVVFIKDTRPGGADQNPAELWHSNLVLSLSDTLIGADMGVTATIKAWENMRVNDLVMFYWGGERIEVPRVTQDQVGNDLVFTIGNDLIQLIGSGHYVVKFYLYDEVKNKSGELQPWSKDVVVTVDLGQELLPAPIIAEVDDATGMLDADALKQEPAHAFVEVPFKSPYFQKGDFILLTVSGTTLDGVYVSESLSLPVDKIPNWYEFPIRNELVRSLIQSSLTVQYVRQRIGEDTDLPSRKTTVSVGGRRFELPKPFVQQAEGPFIEPDLPYVTVEMPDYQPPGTAADTLTVRMQGFHQDNTQELISSSRLAGSHVRTRDFQNAEYMRFEGLHETNVHYIVTGSTGIRESERAWVQIGRPARTLPAPIIHEAINGNVDPALVGSVGTLELLAPFKAGDKLTVKYVGSESGEEELYFDLFLDADKLELDIPKRLFTDNLDGTLTVSYWVERFGTYLYSLELVVTVGTALGELFLPLVLEAATDPDELDPALVWPDGATVRVRYEQIKSRDQVEVSWVGLPGLGTHSEIKQDQTGDYIDFTIPTEAIGFNIHPDGRDIQVSFSVIRNGYATSSPVLTLRLLTLLDVPGPLIDSILDNAVLAIELLRDMDKTRVARWPYGALQQRMWLSYSGVFSNDDNYIEDDFKGREVDASEVSNGVSSYTPVLRLRNLKEDSELTIKFWVTFDHSGNINNAVLFEVRHHLVHLKESTYPYPQIKDSTPAGEQEVSINPLVVQDKCQVLVSYENMNSGGTDKITLHWIHADGSMPFIQPQDGLDGGTVTFNINNSILGSSLNTTVRLQYTVELARGGTASSEEQIVKVGTIAASSLPRPTINRLATGTALNPPTMTGDVQAIVAKWPLSVTGQRVWLSVSSPGLVTQNLRVNHPLTSIEQANGLVDVTQLRSWLLGVPNNGNVTVSLKVTFDGSEEIARAISFPTSVYPVRLISPLVFDTNTGYLRGRTYVLPDYAWFPNYNSSNSMRRVASGGKAPYSYSSSNTGVAGVDSSGYVTARGNGGATITVRDSSSPAQTRSYAVYVSGVVGVYGLDGGTWGVIVDRASRRSLRVPSIVELREIRAAYSGRWPMGNESYWTSDLSHKDFYFFRWFWTVNLVTGSERPWKDLLGFYALGVGIR